MDERLDGEIAAKDAIDLEVHLRECSACREIASGLEGVVYGLSHLPTEAMPEDDLQSVLRRTVGAARDRSASSFVPKDVAARANDAIGRSGARRWTVRSRYVLAVAAMLAALAIVPFAFRQVAPPEPSSAEVEAAAQEARMVLALASRAVRSAESAARNRVIKREVAPALKHVPVRWHHDPPSRRNGA